MFIAGLTPEILWAAVWIFLCGTWIVSRHLPLRWAFALVALRVMIPVAYFAMNPGGILQLSDDQYYFHTTVKLLKLGYTPLSIFTDPWGIPFLSSLTGTRQIAYNLWNLLAMWLFGPYYFAPVLLNVGATIVGGWFFFRILGSLGFERQYRQWALAFFLLHWDVVVWSSFLNLKDVLVMTLTLVTLHEMLRFYHRPSLAPAAGVILVLGVLLFLRFYIPFVLLTAAFGFLLERERSLRKTFLLVLVAGGIVGLVLWKFPAVFSLPRYIEPGQVFWGVPHFILTPLPWNLSPGYQFLYFPAWLWLALAGPALITIPFLWVRHPNTRLLFIYLVLIILFYAIAPDLRGPRHRVQVTFIFVWMQFHVLWVFAGRLSEAVRPIRNLPASQGDPAR